MIIEMTNKDNDFYQYMGRFFGSRAVERQVNDRIYDDDNKVWYMFIEEEKVKAFVSMSNGVIKNIYTTKDEYLEKILKKILKKDLVSYGVVTNKYVDIYKKSGLLVSEEANYRNFVTVYKDAPEMLKI